MTGVVPRGLATVAMLKVNYDNGRDYIEMFQPFVLDAIKASEREDFTLEYLQHLLKDRHGLDVPSDTLRTLLARAKRNGFVDRQGGRYYRTIAPGVSNDLEKQRGTLEAEHKALGDSLRLFSARKKGAFATSEDALSAMWTFIGDYHVPMLLDYPVETAEPSAALLHEDKISRRSTHLIAKFIRDVVPTNAVLQGILSRMLEGYVLQNVLLLRDIEQPTARFQDLTLFLDTGIMLAALGFTGEAEARATKEFLSLVRTTGATLRCFDQTVLEMKRILRVHETKLGTHEGRMSLYQTPVSRYFLTKQFTPSDIVQEMALLEQYMNELGIVPVPTPARVAQFTEDEASLMEILKGTTRYEQVENRVVHDVNCIAAVLTLRAGQTAPKLDTAKAVFVTTGALTIKNVNRWYRERVGHGVSPIVHRLAVSHNAWLKQPSAGPGLKFNEFVAVCSALSRPTREQWKKFLDELNRLDKDGSITTDECAAIVASEFADQVLLDAIDDADGDVDADSIAEVIERVRAHYTGEAAERLANAQHHVRASQELHNMLVSGLKMKANRIARIASWLPTVLLGTVFAIGMLITLPGSSWLVNGTPSFSQWLVLLVVIVCSLLSVFTGFNLLGVQRIVEKVLAPRIERWLLPNMESLAPKSLNQDKIITPEDSAGR